MPGQPLKRIYFDANFLPRWPNVANSIGAVLYSSVAIQFAARNVADFHVTDVQVER